MPVSDHVLVGYVRNGDQAAAEELFRRYAARIRGVVADHCGTAFRPRFDADDVVQSVFRILYDGIRSRHYDVPADGELWGLLSVLAVNKVRDLVAYHRAAKRNVFRTVADDGELAQAFAHEDHTTALLRLVVREYLVSLTDADRAVVALRMTGHTVADISARTGRAIRAVERTLRKARDDLAEVLTT